MDTDENVLSLVIMFDRAYIHFNKYGNKHNFQYKAEVCPIQPNEQHLYSIQVTIWCAVYVSGVITEVADYYRIF